MSLKFEALFQRAVQAGNEAVAKFQPVPMIVQSATALYFVADGVCGFAWVHLAATSSFAKWMKKSGVARAAYKGGLDYSIREFGQSMEKKEVFARAFAGVLQEAGIKAYADSRID